MKISPLVAVYSLTLLVSAALLFSIQPVFSKMILPMLGGTPQVWNIAMLFFQVALLGGYAYAHGTTRYLSIRAQAVLHFFLLLVFTVVLPIAIPAGWVPPADKDPTLWQLALMTITVGGPFFVLAGSAPMLQRWFSASNDKDADNPYFLYGASNLGSMSALLAYPIIIEPLFDLPHQSLIWSLGYFLLIALSIGSASFIWKNNKAKAKPVRTEKRSKNITWRMRIIWMFLAALPSSLMLGVTTYITTDIASVPLLWIMPLALYVGTFIIVFARKPLITAKQSTMLQGCLFIILVAQRIGMPNTTPYILIVLQLTIFFISALTCHFELARTRPAAKNLTEFYLFMSIGGAIGGFFNAIIAPQLLILPIEYVLALVLACSVREMHDPSQSFAALKNYLGKMLKAKKVDRNFHTGFYLIVIVTLTTLIIFYARLISLGMFGCVIIAVCMSYVMDRRWLFTTLLAIVLFFFPLGYDWGTGEDGKVIYRNRNFFGVVKIVDDPRGERILMNGTTNHGAQALDPKYRLTPLSYYAYSSPLEDIFNILDTKAGKQNVGVVGLGVGVTACFSKPGRSYDYYEINKLVKGIAENPALFTWLKECGSPYKIILGDGRLTLKQQKDNTYDLLIIDAFTSDNIPIHLLTIEALQMYFEKIKENGILTIHISNRFLDLEPVLQKASEVLGVPSIGVVHQGQAYEGTSLKSQTSHWIVFTKNKAVIDNLSQKNWSETRPRRGVKAWTDKYSNIFSVIDNQIGEERIKESIRRKKEEKAAKEKAAAQ